MKLEWQENLPEEPMTWDKAMEYAESLGCGWRLPTVTELKEAYDDKVEGFKSDYYWSSSTYAQNTNFAWGVDFDDGFVDSSYKAFNYYVRCVRDVK